MSGHSRGCVIRLFRPVFRAKVPGRGWKCGAREQFHGVIDIDCCFDKGNEISPIFQIVNTEYRVLNAEC